MAADTVPLAVQPSPRSPVQDACGRYTVEGAKSLNLARRLKDKEGSTIAENLEIKTDFLEWFCGFTDAEGNFNITLRKLNNNTYSTAMLTFQITLHLNDLPLFSVAQEYIKENVAIFLFLVQDFVNDKDSLIEVILPLFNSVNLNSSKFYQFIVFEKAVNVIKDKRHLTAEGKLEMIFLSSFC